MAGGPIDAARPAIAALPHLQQTPSIFFSETILIQTDIRSTVRDQYGAMARTAAPCLSLYRLPTDNP